jgi:hypothetical protein
MGAAGDLLGVSIGMLERHVGMLIEKLVARISGEVERMVGAEIGAE